MKITLPDVPSELTPGSAALVKHEASLEGVLLQGLDLASVVSGNLNLNEVILRKCNLLQARLQRLRASDTEFDGCDLSAADCSESSFIRTRLSRGRMTGVILSNALNKDVTFLGCKLDMANFRFAKFTRVQFIDCSLVDADFTSAELEHTTFAGCTIERTVFHHCKVRQVDLRGAQLVSLSGWQYLKGATLDDAQLMSVAPQIAAELGLHIADS
ncbi:MAG TPA: pentapeptide repeat-containing protein [Bacillota bacterium]|nr:pentapeptide repeat-containing protein [Bacillota bacterium]